MSGLLLPVFSLSQKGDAPADLGDSSRAFVDLLATAGLDGWLILPIGPTRVDRRLCLLRCLLYNHIGDLDGEKLAAICEPLRLNENPLWFDKCPYLPTSAFAVNPFYIDTDALVIEQPSLTRSLYSEPLPCRSYCPWVTGWLEKHEKLALAFDAKQQTLCTDRQILSHIRSLIFYESRCKAQRSSDDRMSCILQQTKNKVTSPTDEAVAANTNATKEAAIPTKETAISAKETAPPNDDFKEREENFTPMNADGAATGDTTATAMRCSLAESLPPVPEAITTGPEWLQSFWAFISCDENRHWILDYAAFEALLDQEALRWGANNDNGEAAFIRDWQEWPSSEIAAEERVLHLWDNSEPFFSKLGGGFCTSQEFQRSFIFHLYCQFVAISQMKALNQYALTKGVQICGDCPIYLPLQSCDCWIGPQVFGLDKTTGRPKQVSGLPPDFWSSEGQLWNTPLFNWDEGGAAAERWWFSRMSHALGLSAQMRIDHFRAFADFWAVDVEWAETKRNGLKGVWKEGPGAPFFERFFAAHPEISPSRIIVEDLCEPTVLFTEMRKRLPFARMEVLQFHLEHIAVHKDEDSWLIGKAKGPLVIFTGTHDNPTLGEWLTESASDEVKEFLAKALGRVPMRSKSLPRFLLAWMMKQLKLTCEGEEVCVYVPVQDLLCLGAEGRLNRPGAFEPSMWSWRLSQEQMAELSGLSGWMRAHLSQVE